MSAVTRTSQGHRALTLAAGLIWFAVRVLGRVRGSQVMTIGLVVLLVDRGLFAWAAGVAVIAVALIVAPLFDDGTDEVYVSMQVRASGRAWCLYGRRWSATMYAAGLGDPSAQGVPYLVKVRRVEGGDVLVLQTLPGQPAHDVVDAVPHMTRLLGAARGVIRSIGPGVIWLEISSREPAEKADDPHDTATVPGIVVGVAADGQPWTLALRTNVLVAGDAGTGTSSVVRAIVRASRPLIHEGWLAIWAVDTSGGHQLAGAAPYEEVAFGGIRDAAELLDRLRREVRLRAERHLGRPSDRCHVPSPEEPAILVVIDDLSTVLAGAALELDVRCRQLPRILHTVLSQGPGVGIVVAAVMKRRDEQLRAWRHLLGTRVALRLADPAATDDVLGGGARRLGAACERIAPPPTGAAIAWAWSPTDHGPVHISVETHEFHARSA